MTTSNTPGSGTRKRFAGACSETVVKACGVRKRAADAEGFFCNHGLNSPWSATLRIKATAIGVNNGER
ncbi:hypothetical protein ACGFZU_41015 [Streptomyces tendae]|uniref:hypothetical protein n=1 Tax=Streptomyces tendae TaxID=1932 RepID=UPI003719C754